VNIDHCEFPDNLFYDVENNVWFQKIETGSQKKIGQMGISSVLVFLTGKISGIKFRPLNEDTKKGQSIATIESIRYFGAVRSPIQGKISKLNEYLISDPALVSESPYENWIAEYETFDEDSLDGLLYGIRAKDELLSRIKELRIRCFKLLPDEEMYSIGTECTTTLANLNELLADKHRGYVVHLVTDDPTADIEMVRWSMQTRNELVETRQEENLYHFIVKKV
jgi:glycine cleavage system H lipoate-binding protein/TusA-related sulfurtransferase